MLKGLEWEIKEDHHIRGWWCCCLELGLAWLWRWRKLDGPEGYLGDSHEDLVIQYLWCWSREGSQKMCSMSYWEDQVCKIPWNLLNPWDWNFLGEIPGDFSSRYIWACCSEDSSRVELRKSRLYWWTGSCENKWDHPSHVYAKRREIWEGQAWKTSTKGYNARIWCNAVRRYKLWDFEEGNRLW